MRVIIRGNWANYIGTDYCDALGIYDTLDDAGSDAESYAWDKYEEPEDEDGIEDEGPDYYTEEYNPEAHDMLRAGGGSFADDFERMES